MTEPSQAPLRYAVLLADASGFKPGALAQALGPALKKPAQDLIVPVRKGRGLLADDLSQEEAQRVAQALAEKSVTALAVPRGLLEDLPKAEPLKTLNEPVAPELLAAAVFKRTTSRTVKVEEGPSMGKRAVQLGITLATGLPVGLMGGGKKEVERTIESSDLAYVLDVVAGGRRLRVDAEDFDFSCLGERKGYDAPGNFRRLIEVLAPSARLVNEGARALLASRPLRELGYESAEDLDAEERWLLTLAALKKA